VCCVVAVFLFCMLVCIPQATACAGFFQCVHVQGWRVSA
jgi:hypothetical protein